MQDSRLDADATSTSLFSFSINAIIENVTNSDDLTTKSNQSKLLTSNFTRRFWRRPSSCCLIASLPRLQLLEALLSCLALGCVLGSLFQRSSLTVQQQVSTSPTKNHDTEPAKPARHSNSDLISRVRSQENLAER